jgi:hypothetical protein
LKLVAPAPELLRMPPHSHVPALGAPAAAAMKAPNEPKAGPPCHRFGDVEKPLDPPAPRPEPPPELPFVGTATQGCFLPHHEKPSPPLEVTRVCGTDGHVDFYLRWGIFFVAVVDAREYNARVAGIRITGMSCF